MTPWHDAVCGIFRVSNGSFSFTMSTQTYCIPMMPCYNSCNMTATPPQVATELQVIEDARQNSFYGCHFLKENAVLSTRLTNDRRASEELLLRPFLA